MAAFTGPTTPATTMINCSMKRTDSEMEVIRNNQCFLFLTSDGSDIKEVVLCNPKCCYNIKDSYMTLACSEATREEMRVVWNQYFNDRHRKPFPVLYPGEVAPFGECIISKHVKPEANYEKETLMFSVRATEEPTSFGIPRLKLNEQCLSMPTGTSVPSVSTLCCQETPSSSAAGTCYTQSALNVL